MEEAKLQLSHLYWTTSSLADRIAIFQRFLNIDNTVTKEKQNNYTKFDIKGKNISIQIIFLDNAEVVPTKFDTDIFKLIFLPNGTSQEVVDKITGETSTFAFLFEDDINSIIKGLKVEELSLYKVFYHFIKSNSFESKSYDQDDIQRFYQNSLKRNVHLSDFEFATVIDKLSLENHPRNNVKHRKTTQLLNEIRKDGVSNIILNGKSASGKTTLLVNPDGTPKKGYIYANPLVSIYTIDLRPMQVTINANNRVLNAKLVQFNPKGFKTFVAWHGNADYTQDGLKDILMSYAYDPTSKNYDFLTILKELKNEDSTNSTKEVESNSVTNKVVTDTISK